MASPFTGRTGDIRPCADIIRQGRTTLVTTVQMFKILGLLCLSTAYSLSVQYLQVRLAPTAAHFAAAVATAEVNFWWRWQRVTLPSTVAVSTLAGLHLSSERQCQP